MEMEKYRSASHLLSHLATAASDVVTAEAEGGRRSEVRGGLTLIRGDAAGETFHPCLLPHLFTLKNSCSDEKHIFKTGNKDGDQDKMTFFFSCFLFFFFPRVTSCLIRTNFHPWPFRSLPTRTRLTTQVTAVIYRLSLSLSLFHWLKHKPVFLPCLMTNHKHR